MFLILPEDRQFATIKQGEKIVRKFIASGAALAMVLMLCLMAVPAMAAEEQSATANVTVTEYISITLTDTAPAGIQFGNVAPGSSDNPDTAQNNTIPSVNITVASETNINVNLTINGTDFSGAGTITIDNAKWNAASDNATATALSTTYANFATNQAPGNSTELWHWLTIPAMQAAGDYSSTFSYKAVKYT